MTEPEQLRTCRLANWGQTPATRASDPVAALRLIERVGVVTLFPASPEVPNLFHAYLGDPTAAIDSGWGTPSGHVYGWRWELGRRETAFYSTLVRRRPTWIAWPLLPAALRRCGDPRPPAGLHTAGALSANALRVAEALAGADGTLSTGELRAAAGFPTGKAHRAAYLRAVQELLDHLLLAKVFAADPADLDMRHTLVRSRYPEAVAAAERLSAEEAVDRLLGAYLPAAAYAAPVPLARHLRLRRGALVTGIECLAERGEVTPVPSPEGRETWYAWTGPRQSDAGR